MSHVKFRWTYSQLRIDNNKFPWATCEFIRRNKCCSAPNTWANVLMHLVYDVFFSSNLRIDAPTRKQPIFKSFEETFPELNFNIYSTCVHSAEIFPKQSIITY